MRLAITQGRLSRQIGKKIQSFPSESWEEEFEIAKSIGLKNIEWIIDFKTLYSNPIFKR